MDWNQKLQKIVDYTEDCIQRTEDSVDSDEISRIAGCSYSFFLKVFSYMNGISYAEYFRRRKLTLAGYDLRNSRQKVIDISYKYGYDSPTSFTKAFQQFHGFPPRDARNTETVLKVYPKMQITSPQEYEWRLEEKQELHLVGKKIKISHGDPLLPQIIPAFWNTCQQDGTYTKLFQMSTACPGGLFGLFLESSAQESEYAIMVCTDLPLPADCFELRLPAETWAVFDCRGAVPDAIQNGWKFLQNEWLVEYPFQHANCPELEWYSTGNSFGKDYLSQIWIPVIVPE